MTASRTLSAVSKPNAVRRSGSWTFTYHSWSSQRSSHTAQKECPARTGVSMSVCQSLHTPSPRCHGCENRSAYDSSREIGSPSGP
jgi:hypothetical protein